MKRAIVIVLDGVGIGALPDAVDYGDEGSNTLANLASAAGGLNIPNLGALGLGNIGPIDGVPSADKPMAAYGKMAEKSIVLCSAMGWFRAVHTPTPVLVPVMVAVTTPFPQYTSVFVGGDSSPMGPLSPPKRL